MVEPRDPRKLRTAVFSLEFRTPGLHAPVMRISSDHPEYGEDRIALELEVKFGIRHASSTVRRYMVKRCPPSDSQAWRSFLKNQAKAIWTCDFLVQHTVGFRVLYVFIILELSRPVPKLGPLENRS